jgi:transposase
MCLHPKKFLLFLMKRTCSQSRVSKGIIYATALRELGSFIEDEDFASLYAQRGQPAQAPWRLAMILVMQLSRNLSDRQAAQAVQGRID